ncbi:E3 ubiquitin-protein ligase RNF169 [Salarias fasciatus]|uniref:RING-type E3 ubiquitin transferase n=1 Tax=Salarias fasciatus TaxID=181472 RepID=A0A672GC88_SALFA|nr:E3 ubiquitin-protein ligase RNF169 [Salarias fasciatus]
MATAGSAERPGSPVRPGAGPAGSGAGPRAGSRSRSRSRSGPPPGAEDGPDRCAPSGGGGSARGHPAHRHSDGERLRRRSDPERSSSRPARRDGDCRRDLFVSPALINKSSDPFPGKLKGEDRDESRRKNSEFGWTRRDDEPGVLSDSENEEPISRQIRNISSFIRRTKNSSSLLAVGCQRSRSCTDPVEDRGGKLKAAVLPAAMMERVGISHSFAAGILLSSENSRSVSAPTVAPERRPAWRAVLTPSTPPVLPPPRPERSISPESNDSISEELNHFKPIVCSPCTPPKRLPDGRLVEPTIVKSTPRNLTRGLQKATSYEASPAVLQKWRQIELDRQSLKVSSRSTLTSPVSELHARANGGEDGARARPSANKRRLLFEPPDADGLQRQSVKIRVPAVRYGAAAPRPGPDLEAGVGGAEPCGVGALFSPLSKNSGFQLCKLVPKDSQSPQKDPGDSSIHNQSTSRRGKKRKQKTKHLDPGAAAAARDARQLQQERQDRALALRLQRQFDLENQSAPRRRSPDAYCLRSWMSSQNRRRRGLRSSRRIGKKL